MDKTLANKKSSRNIGVSILRIFMCFVVIQEHYSTQCVTLLQRIVFRFSVVAVPCFMFVSFYLTADKVFTAEAGFIRKRLFRLWYPILCWSIIAFLVRSNMQEDWLDWHSILHSLVFGSSSLLNPPLWYNSTQLILLFFMVVLCIGFAENKSKDLFLLVIVILSFILQYTGINDFLFSGLPYESIHTLMRVVETLPMAATGLWFARNVKRNAADKRMKYLGMGGGIAAACVIVKILTWYVPGLARDGYGGISTYFSALLICFVCIYLIPEIRNSCISRFIHWAASYTNGIYCMHFVLGLWLAMTDPINKYMRVGTLWFDLFIFLIGLGFSIIIDFIGAKSRLLGRWIFPLVK